MVALAVFGLIEMHRDEKNKFIVELTDDEITQLAESVEFHIKLWPGYPAAEKEEQVRLLELRSLLRVGMLEVSFHKD